MEFEARLKAVARLAESTTEAAARALQKEFDAAASALATGTEYDQLEQSLAVVNAIGFRFSATAARILAKFADRIEQRQLTYSEQDRLFGSSFRDYRNATSLIVLTIQALAQLRYLETPAVLRALMRLTLHSADSVRKKATEGLKELSEYDIGVFYGENQSGGIGPTPQKQVVDELQELTDADVTTYFSAILTLLDGVLSPTMEGTSWSYKALTLSHTATPAIPSVSDVRAHAIDQLIRIYSLADSTRRKLSVVESLTNATRTGVRVARSDEASAMFIRDAQKVLAFFAHLIETDELEIVQKIEHNTYWIFVHAISEDIRVAALKVRDNISEHSEYVFYRMLVGFEGIFGDWQELHGGGSEFKETDELRRRIARGYAEHINDGNYVEWRNRILRYMQTQSDDIATFSVFYFFLESFALSQPTLAFKLLTEDTEAIRPFLIPLLRGLWSGPRNTKLRDLIESWMNEGRNLYPTTKLFLSNADLDTALVKRLLSRAAEINDLSTIREVISVAISNYGVGRQALIDELMLPAIELLTERANCDWLFDNWFRRELKDVLPSIEPRAIDVLLRNLKCLRKIDYHAEELLYIIAQRAPDKVLEYLCERLDRDARDSTEPSGAFEAIPYEFHKLNEPLARIPGLAVRSLRDSYVGDYSHFIYGGARLLSNIFPKFSDEFEAELLKQVQEGSERSLEFVLAVLRNYRGQSFIHRLCKEIVKSIPVDSKLRTEVAIALETTGVVTGEFGISEAYERKRLEVLDWLTDADERVQAFAKWYIADLERMRDGERKRAEEDIALRKFRYGED
jgi:hypothetical protein